MDVENYEEQRSSAGKAWSDPRFTLSIGELKQRKGLHLALAAWCRCALRHPDLHHFIVGNRSGDDYEESLLSLVRESGLEDRVHFLGNIDEQEKIELLQRAEVFLHTPVTASDGGFEGFGIVYLEAAASAPVHRDARLRCRRRDRRWTDGLLGSARGGRYRGGAGQAALGCGAASEPGRSGQELCRISDVAWQCRAGGRHLSGDALIRRFLANRFVRNSAALQIGALFNSLGGLASILLLAFLLGSKLQGEYYTAVAMYAGLALIVSVGILQGRSLKSLRRSRGDSTRK